MRKNRGEYRSITVLAVMLTVIPVALTLAVFVVAPLVTDRSAAENSSIVILPFAWQDSGMADTIQISEQEEGGRLEPGREVRVTMKDGRTFRGEFVRKDRLNVVIKIAGIETKFDAMEVDSVVPLKTFEEQYRQLKQAIRREDFNRRYQLAEWLYGRKMFELAAEEAETLLDDAPSFEDARDLLRLINKSIELERSRDERRESDHENVAVQNRAEESDRKFIEAQVLSDDEVNLLRVYEVNLDDPPRMIVSRETIEKIFEQYGDNELLPQTDSERRQFYLKEPVEILDLLFELQARDLYGEIRVLGEPAAFMKFRLDVHRTWLINACATTECHGGTEAGNLFLFNRRSNDSRTVYTNFLILERTRINDVPLLDYEEPEESLLLQMGLPPGLTARPHPRVDKWRPIFDGRSDPLYQKAVDWLNAMYRPRPDYPIEFRLPRIGQTEPDGKEDGVPHVDSGQDIVEDEGVDDAEGRDKDSGGADDESDGDDGSSG